jgi:hypothetical protein
MKMPRVLNLSVLGVVFCMKLPARVKRKHQNLECEFEPKTSCLGTRNEAKFITHVQHDVLGTFLRRGDVLQLSLVTSAMYAKYRELLSKKSHWGMSAIVREKIDPSRVYSLRLSNSDLKCEIHQFRKLRHLSIRNIKAPQLVPDFPEHVQTLNLANLFLLPTARPRRLEDLQYRLEAKLPLRLCKLNLTRTTIFATNLISCRNLTELSLADSKLASDLPFDLLFPHLQHLTCSSPDMSSTLLPRLVLLESSLVSLHIHATQFSLEDAKMLKTLGCLQNLTLVRYQGPLHADILPRGLLKLKLSRRFHKFKLADGQEASLLFPPNLEELFLDECLPLALFHFLPQSLRVFETAFDTQAIASTASLPLGLMQLEINGSFATQEIANQYSLLTSLTTYQKTHGGFIPDSVKTFAVCPDYLCWKNGTKQKSYPGVTELKIMGAQPGVREYFLAAFPNLKRLTCCNGNVSIVRNLLCESKAIETLTVTLPNTDSYWFCAKFMNEQVSTARLVDLTLQCSKVSRGAIYTPRDFRACVNLKSLCLVGFPMQQLVMLEKFPASLRELHLQVRVDFRDGRSANSPDFWQNLHKLTHQPLFRILSIPWRFVGSFRSAKSTLAYISNKKYVDDLAMLHFNV